MLKGNRKVNGIDYTMYLFPSGAYLRYTENTEL